MFKDLKIKRVRLCGTGLRSLVRMAWPRNSALCSSARLWHQAKLGSVARLGQ